jgi:hypothetical protein
MANRLQVWRRGTLGVTYRCSLEGGGTFSAEPFARFIRERCERRPVRFERAFEWCSGPGFIGFTLLAEGICSHLCLADINPAAIDCVRRTVARNHLEARVSYYVSDNFANIPRDEQFDLIVGNPPSYSGLNPMHPSYDRYKNDVRVNDPNWSIRRDFYRNVKRYMKPDAWLFIAKVAVTDTEVHTPSVAEPYDIRVRQPLLDFQEMVVGAGLTFLGAEPLLVAPGGFRVDMLFARNDP